MSSPVCRFADVLAELAKLKPSSSPYRGKMPSNLLVLLDLIGIDREVLVADRLQVTAVTGIADQRLRS